ncbi:AMP-binding protein [Microbacterium sp. NIBRBAC000506063]|uniref:AMP-binding protein n=1 Tax=Microbacterium sp. NIBRBAC000506063 TaxID=2734618 RepID=UPI001BB50C33|nr:AMP-binding protein [Microbacterium sp. NIBRBAC000506063]QTV80097.1 AMP-binding protein [Microbacterium sp. NIBRBAC000506063]
MMPGSADWHAASTLDERAVERMLEADTGVVIHTSGSSGVPKRVAISAAALRASAEATATRIGAGRWTLALPTHYIAGLQVLLRSVLAGTSPVALAGRFTAEAFAEATLAASDDSALYTSLVPAQLATLVDAAETDAAIRDAATAYRAVLVGGQSTPVALRERAAALGIRLVRTYGSSETSGGCIYDGVPLDGVRVRVVSGELRIAGPVLADGYLEDPALTARAFVSDAGTRWYRTGDLGTFDAGVVAVHGRVDNVIVSGGVNVSLDRVERVVREVPELSGAVVVGADDERWGQASVIVAALAAGSDAAALLGTARARVEAGLGAPARPRELRAVEAMPLLPSGKPDRGAIAALVRD